MKMIGIAAPKNALLRNWHKQLQLVNLGLYPAQNKYSNERSNKLCTFRPEKRFSMFEKCTLSVAVWSYYF